MSYDNEIAKLFDENNNENLFLYDEDDNQTEFEQVAIIPLGEALYAILKPVAEMQGVGDDEAIVFEIQNVDDEDCLVVAEDDEVIDAVFREYYALLKENGMEVDDLVAELDKRSKK